MVGMACGQARCGCLPREGVIEAVFSEEVRRDEIQRINQRKSIDKGVGLDKCKC